jgi:hypothetical protein
MQGKMLRQVLDKMMQHGTAQNARVQVCLPDGKFYDISSQLMMPEARRQNFMKVPGSGSLTLVA